MHNVAQLRRLREHFPNELVVIGVHSAKFPSEQLTENIRAAALRHGIEHPIVNDAGFRTWSQYNVHAWPTVFLIDPRGKIAGSQSGEIDAEALIPTIEKLIAAFDGQALINRRPVEVDPEIKAEPRRPLSFPAKLLITPNRMLYIADTGHHRILEVELDDDFSAGEIRRVFGSGHPGFEDGQAREAAFHHPRGIALHSQMLYVADTENHAVRAIDLEAETVTTVAGTGEKGGPRLTPGVPTETSLRSPWALFHLESEEGENLLFIAMAGSHQIWILLDNERVGIFAGNGREALVDGPVAEASFNQPSDLAFGLGHLFVADAEASAIRAISFNESPQVFTLVGQGLFEFGDVDGAGPEVRLQHAAGLTVSEGRLVYVADSYNHKIKTLDPTIGQVQTLIGTGEAGQADGSFDQAELFQPEGVVISGDHLLVADTNNHLIRVADLRNRKVQTLLLRGLERLEPASRFDTEARRLEAVKVSPGEARIILDVQLPGGYKLNEETSVTIRQQSNGKTDLHQFAPDEPIRLELKTEQDREIHLELVIYYCEETDARLCRIHTERLVLPVEVSPSAGPEVRIPYSISG